MFFSTADYADFLVLTANLAERKSVVFYNEPALGFHVVMLVAPGLAISCSLSSNKPASFNTDFPNAIALASGFAVG